MGISAAVPCISGSFCQPGGVIMCLANVRRLQTVCLGLLFLALAPALAQANWLGGIEFSEPSPSHMQHDQRIYVDIDYKVTDPGGARIFVLPYTDGSPTPSYAVSPSGLVPMGTGTVERFLFITSGTPMVDHVRIKMTNADQSETYLELYVRTVFLYGPSGISNIQFSQLPYSCLMHDDQLYIDFDYATSEAPDLRIWARPMTNGHLSPGYAASGSALLPPVGSYSQNFTFPTADADVDQVRFQMWDGDETEMLMEFFVSVDYLWRQVGITNMVFDLPSPASMHHDHNVTSSFDYQSEFAGNLRIWVAAFTDGSYTPGSHYAGSPAEPPGDHSITRSFGVHEGAPLVNQARVLVRDEEQTQTLCEFTIPVRYQWGPHAVNNIRLDPQVRAILDNDEDLFIDWDYQTSHDDIVRIWARPFYQGSLAPGYSASGSPAYPPGEGSGDGTFGFGSGNHEVDQIRFQMWTDGQTELLLEYFVNVAHFWGEDGTMTPVEEGQLPQLSVLGQNYPNPFNPTTTIPVIIGSTTHVRLAIYDLRGHLVQTLADEMMAAGRHELLFDGTELPSGTYFYRLEGVGVPQPQRIMQVK